MNIGKRLNSLGKVLVGQNDIQKNCLRRGRVCYILNFIRVFLVQI